MNKNKIREFFKEGFYFAKHIIRKPYDIFRKNKINRTNHITSRAIVKYSRLGSYNYIAGGTGMYNVTMGSYCSIGPRCLFGGMEHDYKWYSTSARLNHNQKGVAETIIGNDVWIGANCIIKAGVKIGDGAVVGANSLVTKDVEPFAIVYGSPAAFVRFRFSEEICNAIIESKYWDLTPTKARERLLDLKLLN
jgi:acetyltransferase-like isoleucine patch superfamily enzyme